MWELAKTKTIMARKEHNCEASDWITNSNYGEIDFDPEDWAIIQKAKDENWKIKKGDLYLYTTGKYDGEFCAYKARIDLDKICKKYDLYCE